MNESSSFDYIVPQNFIQATRDSGYKSLGSALAELVDNAFEAKATSVAILIEKVMDRGNGDVRVSVADDGRGMDASTLRHALQFGWSSRFNQRDSHGRYGMGLPNASISHSRRFEVYSSANGRLAKGTFLDVDEVVGGKAKGIAPARTLSLTVFRRLNPFGHGTVVVWRRCDRLLDRKLGPLTRRLRAELGRLFRYQLWAGKRITINEEAVIPFDPLFERQSANLSGAQPFGPELSYEIVVPIAPARKYASVVRVRFTELPISEWHSLSNKEKNVYGIAKNAGVSVVRAGREIDRGWFFMGQKRKENYDDWWRCEVRFEPHLDELFGVTHTKQEIHPSEKLTSILAPDIQKIARELNARARTAFLAVKTNSQRRRSEKLAERHDNLIEPPPSDTVRRKPYDQLSHRRRRRVAGLEYRIEFRALDSPCLYDSELDGSRLTVALNQAHPFVRRLYGPEPDKHYPGTMAYEQVELIILAAARAEATLSINNQSKKWSKTFLQKWSNILSTYLS